MTSHSAEPSPRWRRTSTKFVARAEISVYYWMIGRASTSADKPFRLRSPELSAKELSRSSRCTDHALTVETAIDTALSRRCDDLVKTATKLGLIAAHDVIVQLPFGPINSTSSHFFNQFDRRIWEKLFSYFIVVVVDDNSAFQCLFQRKLLFENANLDS